MRSTSSLLVAAALAAGACGSEGAEPSGEAPTFEAVVEQVLTPSCTFSSCHTTQTAASNLALTPETACDQLVNKPSCLFPDRMRVMPGNPEESFFFHKLTGEGLGEVPTGDCGSGEGSATKTNLLMPYGAAELSAEKLDLVHGWIAAGAQCTPTGAPDPVNAGPAIASLTASQAAPLAGQSTAITMMLDKAAPKGGLLVTIDTDLSVLTAPAVMTIPEGQSSLRFEALALRPTSRFTLRVRAGESTKDLVLRIGGLEIAEVLSDPIGDDDRMQWVKLRNRTGMALDLTGYQLKAGQGNYDLVTVPLVGSIPAGGCVVIGGPVQSGLNSEPLFSQAVDFTPDLPYAGAQASGFAVFDSAAAPLGNLTTPVDTMLVGANNEAKLLGPDAEIATPYCGTPAAGMSALRTGSGACVQAQMQPRTCL